MYGTGETESWIILICVRSVLPLVREEIVRTGTSDTPFFAFEFRTTLRIASSRVPLIVNFDTAARIGVYVLFRELLIALSPIV
jgi:hypothetical protein